MPIVQSLILNNVYFENDIHNSIEFKKNYAFWHIYVIWGTFINFFSNIYLYKIVSI